MASGEPWQVIYFRRMVRAALDNARAFTEEAEALRKSRGNLERIAELHKLADVWRGAADEWRRKMDKYSGY